MKHFATITIYEYAGRVRRLMKAAGYLKTDLFYDSKGKVYKIATFSDGFIIDSREGKFLNRFQKKCFNE